MHINNVNADSLPTWSELSQFLESRFRTLEMIDGGSTMRHTPSRQKIITKPKVYHTAMHETKTDRGTVSQVASKQCPLCGSSHLLFNCTQFGKQTQKERNDFVQSKRLCYHCLAPTHSVNQCRQSTGCRRCGRRHHSLLHFDKEKNQGTAINLESKHTLLGEPTSSTKLTDEIDIMANFANKKEIGNNNPQYSINVTAFVLKSLTSRIPSNEVQSPDWLEIKKLPLADAGYTSPGKIDILLGAEVYAEILLSDVIKLPQGYLIAQNTIFGWVISGKVSRSASAGEKMLSLHVQVREDNVLKKFWELENEPNIIRKKLTRTEEKYNLKEPLGHYELQTVTFGTACAPYLAVKSLQRLAEEEQNKFPIAAKITKQDFYVDDMMTNCETDNEAIDIYKQMNQLLNSGGFQLQKWNSNSDKFMNFINQKSKSDEKTLDIKSDNTVKVLGIRWNRDTDNFEYTVNLPELSLPITKVKVLSDIAKQYDPMGWIAPVIVTAKIFMQKLWRSGWPSDNELTGDLLNEWSKYREDLFNDRHLFGLRIFFINLVRFLWPRRWQYKFHNKCVCVRFICVPVCTLSTVNLHTVSGKSLAMRTNLVSFHSHKNTCRIFWLRFHHLKFAGSGWGRILGKQRILHFHISIVEEAESLSDHRFIRFEISPPPSTISVPPRASGTFQYLYQVRHVVSSCNTFGQFVRILSPNNMSISEGWWKSGSANTRLVGIFKLAILTGTLGIVPVISGTMRQFICVIILFFSLLVIKDD
ncbi:hypothetical protein K1T71_014952 [Dendrolimus kikuchii]|nr:hypothetical protein K1T71_014952 [Dendrolimus kikuchii]